ncbi:MAG: DUF255 domain-containing protein [Nannocystaceae bacterium]
MLRTPRLALALALTLAAPACARTATDASRTPSAHVDAPPIAWQGWEAEAFARAAAEKKIILVTVVAGWCHWCHVMDEETYTDPAVRALLADRYVAIRVDADARPDLAERYAAWGWPAIALLTPDARPITELRGYQEAPEFTDLLNELVASLDAGTLTGRRAVKAKASGPRPVDALRGALVAQLDGTYDRDEEGWGRRQKYPLAGGIEHALLRSQLRPGEAEWQARALATLERELLLVDPVWGGMYQYSTGGVWTSPHFEKIAKVQAGAVESFALAHRRTGDPRWLAAGDLELRFLREHFRGEEGGFFSSQDADYRVGERAIPGAEFYGKDDAGRRAIGEPRIDRRVYADLNGMIIRALCTFDAVDLRAAGERAPAREMAVAAADHVVAALRQDDGLFRHEAADDGAILYLRDQAEMGRALVALYQATGDPKWMSHARALADRTIAGLRDPESGAFFAHTPDPKAVGVFAERRRPLEENGVMARFLLELHRLLDHTGEALPYADAAKGAITALGDPMYFKEEGRMITHYLMAVEALAWNSIDVTVVGDPSDPRVQRLHGAALSVDEVRKGVELSAPGTRYPDLGKPAVYACSESACSSPITDPAQVRERVQAFAASL